jgi:hypothetical protein
MFYKKRARYSGSALIWERGHSAGSPAGQTGWGASCPQARDSTLDCNAPKRASHRNYDVKSHSSDA